MAAIGRASEMAASHPQLAAGAGPLAGLYGAVIVGFFAALFGGTPSQVSI